MNRRRSIRRIIAKAGTFLLLGAIVNVAVAWGCVSTPTSNCGMTITSINGFDLDGYGDGAFIFEAGLPLHVLRGRISWGYRGETIDGMWRAPTWWPSPRPGLVLPREPIWPGFAINTLFYAAILWLLFATPFALRRWWRIKRGLCPACAYPVGASDLCTECGRPVRASTADFAAAAVDVTLPAAPTLN